MKNFKKILLILTIVITIMSVTGCVTKHNHSYDNDCDTICNTCEATRVTAGHVGGTATCNTLAKCDICGAGYGEYAAHIYDEAKFGYSSNLGHAHVCKVCGLEGVIYPHNPGPEATETTNQVCLDCGYVITDMLDHSTHYAVGEWITDSTSHYHACGGCDEMVDKESHVYDNDCDTVCNTCSYERSEITHTYDSECDSICNLCLFERVASEHTFDNNCDKTCNACNYERETTHTYTNDCDTTCKKNEQGKDHRDLRCFRCW